MLTLFYIYLVGLPFGIWCDIKCTEYSDWKTFLVSALAWPLYILFPLVLYAVAFSHGVWQIIEEIYDSWRR